MVPDEPEAPNTQRKKKRLAPMTLQPEGTEDEPSKRARASPAATAQTLPSPFNVPLDKSAATQTPAPTAASTSTNAGALPSPFKVSTPTLAPAAVVVEVDSKSDLEEVLAALDKVPELSDSSKEMLRAMASPCLETPASERHPMQRGVAEMLRRAVEGVCARLQRETKMAEQLAEAAADKERAKGLLLGRKVEGLRTKVELDRAKARHDADVAANRLERARNLLNTVREEQEKKDGRFIRSALIKDNIGKTLAEHYQPFVEGKSDDVSTHVQAIRALFTVVPIEDSLQAAFDRAASIPAAERSSFDNCALKQLHEDLNKQHEELIKIAENPPRGFEKRKAMVKTIAGHWEEAKAAVRRTAGAVRLSECAAWESEGIMDEAELDLRTAKQASAKAEEHVRSVASDFRSFKQGPMAAMQRLEIAC